MRAIGDDIRPIYTEKRLSREAVARPSYHGCMVAACHIGGRKRRLRLTLSESLFSLEAKRKLDLKRSANLT